MPQVGCPPSGARSGPDRPRAQCRHGVRPAGRSAPGPRKGGAERARRGQPACMSPNPVEDSSESTRRPADAFRATGSRLGRPGCDMMRRSNVAKAAMGIMVSATSARCSKVPMRRRPVMSQPKLRSTTHPRGSGPKHGTARGRLTMDSARSAFCFVHATGLPRYSPSATTVSTKAHTPPRARSTGLAAEGQLLGRPARPPLAIAITPAQAARSRSAESLLRGQRSRLRNRIGCLVGRLQRLRRMPTRNDRRVTRVRAATQCVASLEWMNQTPVQLGQAAAARGATRGA